MRRLPALLFAALAVVLIPRPLPVRAQTITPPAPTAEASVGTGEVSGKIVDQNLGAPVTGVQEVMLHIWDANNTDINMLHASSAADGSFLFTGVDMQAQYVYGVMAIFDGVTYLSQVIPPNDGSNELQLDLPVYETTQDLSTVQVDQMHVLFNFAPDGLELTEIYAVSNSGQRTVKDATKLDDGKTATLRYPLQADADYIFFQPDESDRFVKFAGGFGDTAALLPDEQGSRFAVQYMVPYAGQREYDYTAPVNIKAMNFLLPQNSGVQLKGEGLTGPEPVNSEAGKSYELYSVAGLAVGQTIHVSISGKPAVGGAPATARSINLPVALGGGMLGFAMIGAAIWFWLKPHDMAKDEADVAEPGAREDVLDDVIDRIAQLDYAHEQGQVPDDEYQRERTRLWDEAKSMLDRPQPDGSAPGRQDEHA